MARPLVRPVLGFQQKRHRGRVTGSGLRVSRPAGPARSPTEDLTQSIAGGIGYWGGDRRGTLNTPRLAPERPTPAPSGAGPRPAAARTSSSGTGSGLLGSSSRSSSRGSSPGPAR